ncbi:MAG: dCTP deaminase [Armatimonadetes bacterium]|nr:dCTP deaminase [Armatimonadota bacterium]
MVLSGEHIAALLAHPEGDQRLTIVPLLGDGVRPTEASVDLHLGHHFLLPRRAETPTLVPRKLPRPAIPGQPMQPEEVGLESVWLPANRQLVLHPREFLLTATLEFVGLPPTVCAQVMGRSRWARVGLVVEMASFVHPGYRGCLTLEMQNLGSTPIELQPYLRVAHLVLMQCTKTTKAISPGQVTCAIRPEFWPLVSDSDEETIERLAGR